MADRRGGRRDHSLLVITHSLVTRVRESLHQCFSFFFFGHFISLKSVHLTPGNINVTTSDLFKCVYARQMWWEPDRQASLDYI